MAGEPGPRSALLPYRPGCRLEGEDALQADIVRCFDALFLARQSDAVFITIPNEIGIRVPSKTRCRPELLDWREQQLAHAKMRGARLLATGLLPGATDGILLWRPRGLLFAEVKTAAGRVSPEQRRVAAWLRWMGWPVALWRSWDDAIGDARRMGAVR